MITMSIIYIITTMVPVGCWFVMGALAENSQVGVGRAETSFDYVNITFNLFMIIFIMKMMSINQYVAGRAETSFHDRNDNQDFNGFTA